MIDGFQVAAPKRGNLETSLPHGNRLGNHMETPFDHMETAWKLDGNRRFPAPPASVNLFLAVL
jgi:hypothetical protein